MPNEKEYLAKKSLLDTKQDVLTPGDNITITNNRISAQVPVVDVLVNNQSVIGQDNIARVVVDTVDANPAQTPTDTLTSIDINGTVYELQGGGGGSDVIPNPIGTPTDTLETIEIDGTVFNIAGSGGNSNYTEVSLFTGTSRVTNMALSESIKNFDAIEFQTAWMYNGLPYHISEIITSENLSANNYFAIGVNNYRYVELLVVDNTHINWVTGSDNIMYMKEIKGIKYGSGSGGNSEIIPISAGDGTTSRTFTFDKTPKTVQFYWDDPVLEGTGWMGNGSFIWGQEYLTFPAHTRQVSVTGMMGGCGTLSYGADGKSVTINAPNAFQASNTPNGSGLMYVDYGGGGSGGSSEPDISDMTWTAITSTSYGQSTAVAIPQGTKRLVLTAEYDGIVTKVAEEKIENIQKLLDTSLKSTWNMGAEYADTSGNHTFVAMSVNNNLATAYSGYSGVVVKIYALS